MTRIRILPHDTLCPKGKDIDAAPGTTLCDALLSNGVEVEHACEKSCACTTCHVIIREGFDSLVEAEEKEEDLLDRAWGLEATSRLSCQARVGNEPLTIQIPRYTLNHASEGKR